MWNCSICACMTQRLRATYFISLFSSQLTQPTFVSLNFTMKQGGKVWVKKQLGLSVDQNYWWDFNLIMTCRLSWIEKSLVFPLKTLAIPLFCPPLPFSKNPQWLSIHIHSCGEDQFMCSNYVAIDSNSFLCRRAESLFFNLLFVMISEPIVPESFLINLPFFVCSQVVQFFLPFIQQPWILH